MARKPTPAKRAIATTTTTTMSSPPPIPEPFTPAPSSLTPLLSTLDKTKVYIIHIDRHPAAFKRRIFTVPLLLNFAIFLLLLWRLYVAVPTYLTLVLDILGYQTTAWSGSGGASKTSPASSSRRSTSSLVWLVVRRTTMLAVDYLLATIVWPWPVSFFVEQPANPVLWRWRVGFCDEEIYVRVSRGWGADDLLGGGASSSSSASRKAGGESPFFKVRILPAVERQFMQKTGYLMMGKDWDLDFYAMIVAQEMVKRGEVEMGAMEKKVLVWVPGSSASSSVGGEEGDGQWAVWEVYKLDEGAEDESRKKIMDFRDRLAAMGKEELFFRWVEIIQFESTQPGGFTEERRAVAAKRVAELFGQHGVDFEEFAREVGGLGDLEGVQRAG